MIFAKVKTKRRFVQVLAFGLVRVMTGFNDLLRSVPRKGNIPVPDFATRCQPAERLRHQVLLVVLAVINHHCGDGKTDYLEAVEQDFVLSGIGESGAGVISEDSIIDGVCAFRGSRLAGT